MALLAHKSIEIRPEVWRKLRINAELSGVPLRDYFTYLIESSVPVAEDDTEQQARLTDISMQNRLAARASKRKPS